MPPKKPNGNGNIRPPAKRSSVPSLEDFVPQPVINGTQGLIFGSSDHKRLFIQRRQTHPQESRLTSWNWAADQEQKDDKLKGEKKGDGRKRRGGCACRGRGKRVPSPGGLKLRKRNSKGQFVKSK